MKMMMMGRGDVPSWWVSSRSIGGGRGRWARTCTPLALASMRYRHWMDGAPPSLAFPSPSPSHTDPRGKTWNMTEDRELNQARVKMPAQSDLAVANTRSV